MLCILCILIMLVITFRNWCVKKIVEFCKNYVKKNFRLLVFDDSCILDNMRMVFIGIIQSSDHKVVCI